MLVRKGLLFGIVLLLAVDVVWVGSSGISRHLFHDEHYQKPLLWTYFKTTLFTLYLTAFLFWRPWQRLCWEGCQWRGGRRREYSDAGKLGQKEDRKDGRKNGTIMGRTNGNQSPETSAGLEVDTSCGIDAATGQSTPSHLTQSDNCPTTHDESVEEDGKQESEDVDITSPQLRVPWAPDDEDPVVPQCTRERHGRDNDTDPDLCPAVLGRGEGGNRFTGVSDGRIFFKNPSLNGDNCPVNPPLDTCKLEPCMVGPPEFQPLNCALSEEDRCQTGPLSPCSTKCCKVRFNRTIEVREAKCVTVSTERVSSSRGPTPLMPVRKVATLSLIFGIVWFFANYLYALALVYKSVALVNTLSSMSSVFVMILAALPLLHVSPGDQITLSRVLVSLLSVGGAALVSISDSTETEHKYWSTAAFLALGSALLYAVYLVLLKKLVPNPDSLELPMFFGFVGLFNTVLMLPLVVVWHYAGLEEFEWPPSPNVWTLLLINGFVGTVISELLWLGGVFLTSPLVGTLSLALVTPLSIAYSVFIGQNPFSVKFFVGALMVVVCFVIVAILDHFGSWDPLWALIKRAVTAARDYRAHSEYESLSEESKSLIENEDNPSVDKLSYAVT